MMLKHSTLLTQPAWLDLSYQTEIFNFFIQVYRPWEQKTHSPCKYNRDIPPGITDNSCKEGWEILLLADPPCLVLRERGLKSVGCPFAPCSHAGAGQPLTLPGDVLALNFKAFKDLGGAPGCHLVQDQVKILLSRWNCSSGTFAQPSPCQVYFQY